MIVITFKFIDANNILNTETILANSKEDAEEYLKKLKTKDLKIKHSFIVGEATEFKIFSSDPDGKPLVLDWRGKNLRSSGRVGLWTELPNNLK